MQKFKETSKFKKIVLQICTKSLSPKLTENYLHRFVKYDKDQTFMLTKANLLKALQEGLEGTSIEVTMPEIEELIKKLDTNNTGTINY